MKARKDKHAHRQVRGVLAELGDLVENLGLVEAPTPPVDPDPVTAERPSTPSAPPALSAPPPPSAPVWRSGPEVLTGSAASSLHARAVEAPEAEPLPREPEVELPAVPMWESADAPPATPGAAATGSTSLWETFSPELSSHPPRPWSAAAAMVVLEPIAPPGSSRASDRVPQPRTASGSRRPHAFTVVTTLAVLVAAAVFAFSRMDLGHTTGPQEPVAHAAFVVDSMRVVSAKSAAQVPSAPTAQRFPSTAPAIYLDVAYRNVSPSDALQIVIILEPQHAGQPPVTVSDERHRNLDAGGEIAVTVEAPPGGFTPGTYTVRALHDGTLEQSATFQVTQ